MKVYDISVPLRIGMVSYPGDPAVKFRQHSSISAGDPANVLELSLSSHSGSHFDAPRHFLEGAIPVDQVPVEHFVGPVRVIEIPEDADAVTERHLTPEAIAGAARILLKTRNSKLWGDDSFCKSFVALSRSAAEALLAAGVRTVGIDYLSIERFGGDGEIHRVLLGGGCCIIEGLDLREVPPGDYFLVAPPLRIQGGDGAPVRALLFTASPFEADSSIQEDA